MLNQDFQAPVAPLALTRTADRRSITVHTLGLEGPVEVGTFASSADAWRAIDAIDMGEAVDAPLARVA